MIAARVVQVFAASGAQGRGHTSSGIVLAPGLVLTARHGVEGCDGDPEVRLLDDDAGWHPCEVAWVGEGDCDAALLRTRDREALGARAPLRLGRLVGERRVGELRAIGFPWAQVRAQERGNVSGTEAIDAAVDPLSGRAPGRPGGSLVVHVDGSVPTDRDDGGSPWQGMSGAALLRDDVVVGVIAGDPARFGPDRLLATPASALAADPEFAAVAPAELVDVELLGALDAPYRTPAGGGLSQLLDSRAEVVAFHGREEELAALEAWCAGEARLGVALVAGPGGMGKTRLAAELCRRLRGEGAVAGFWNPRADAEALAGVAAAATTVVVVDEAHTMPAAAAEVVLAHARRTSGGPARVILLARNAADWWRHGVADAVADEPDAEAACRAALMLPLGAVAADPAERRAVFLQAVRDLRARLAPADGDGEPEVPDLSAPEFDAVLYIELAAGRAVAGGGAAGDGAEDLLAWALEREARYWRATAKASDPPLEVDREVLARAVTVATLAVADAEDDAAAALAVIPDLAESARDRRAVARWLRDLYPHDEGDSWLPGLVPDELGDALVRRVLADSPAMAGALLADPRPEQTRSVLRVLDRAARGDDAVERLLDDLVVERVRDLWPAVLEVSAQSGAASAARLARALDHAADADLARAVLEAIPQTTVVLGEPAGVAAELVVGALRAPAADDRARLPQLAEALNQYAIRLSALDRVPEALDAAQEAVAIQRELGAEDPESTSRLARTLGSLANRLTDLGAHEPALQADLEAVELLRGLHDDSPERQSELGWALSQLSSDYGSVGLIGEGLEAAQAALSILEPLFDAHPRPHLAGTLAGAYTNFSNRLTQAGYGEAALMATQRSVDVLRWLAAGQPDAYEHKLAMALANVAIDLRGAGALEEALAAAAESVELMRRIRARAPAALTFDLSHALNSLAVALADLGRMDEALEAGYEVVELRRALVARNPAFAGFLVNALGNHAIDLDVAGREEEAGAMRAEADEVAARFGGG